MRTTVALVEAQPDTIEDDYRRVLDLAGLAPDFFGGAPRLLMAAGSGGYRPGRGTAPWQIDGALNWLGGDAARAVVLALTAGTVGPVPADRVWHQLVDRLQAAVGEEPDLRNHRHVSAALHPALDAVLPNGVEAPVALTGEPVLLLPTPSVQAGWGLAGSVSMIYELVTGGAKVPQKAPLAEVAAEAVGVAHELMPAMGVVMDGTLWGAGAGRYERQCVARNVLLAGSDPVAVDAVAMRLAGVDPQRVAWLRLCHHRGVGRIMASDIQLKGRTDLLDLDFGLRDQIFAAEQKDPWAALWQPLARLFGRGSGVRGGSALGETVWRRLYESYQTGHQTGV